MCRHFPAQVTKTVDQEIKFTSWAKTEPTLFRLYGDLECILKEEDGKTKKVQKHTPCRQLASCNINKKQLKHIPVFFHNLRGYDGHLIMRGIHRHSGKKLNKKNKAENRWSGMYPFNWAT